MFRILQQALQKGDPGQKQEKLTAGFFLLLIFLCFTNVYTVDTGKEINDCYF